MKHNWFTRMVAGLCLVSFTAAQAGWEGRPLCFYLAPKSEWSKDSRREPARIDRRGFLKMVAKAGIAAGVVLSGSFFAAPQPLFAQEGPTSNERVDRLIADFKGVVTRAGQGRSLTSSERQEAIRILNSLEALARPDVPDALNRLIELFNWDKINYSDKPELLDEILRVVLSLIQNHRDQSIQIQLFRINTLQGYPHGREIFVHRDSEERPLSVRIDQVPEILMRETMTRLDVYMERRSSRVRQEVVASENLFVSESEKKRDTVEIRLTPQIYRLYVRAARAGLVTFHWEYFEQTMRDYCDPRARFQQWTHYGLIQAIAEVPLQEGRLEEALALLATWEQYAGSSNPGPNYWEERSVVEALLQTARAQLNRREAERISPPAERPAPALEPMERVEASTPPDQTAPVETGAPTGIAETKGAAAEESWSRWFYLVPGMVIALPLAALLYKIWRNRKEAIALPQAQFPSEFPDLPLLGDETLPLAEENRPRDTLEIELSRSRETIQFGPWRVTPSQPFTQERPRDFLGIPVQFQTTETSQSFSGWLTGNYLIMSTQIPTPQGLRYRAYDVKKDQIIFVRLLTTEHQSYWVISELGRGGMGAVFEVWNPIASRYEAVKTMLSAGSPSSQEAVEAIARFRRETLILGQVSANNPNIVAMHRFGAQPFPHFVMDRIQGKNLASIVKEKQKSLTPDEIQKGKGGLPLDQVIEIGLQAAKGLHHVHTTPVKDEKGRTRVGIVHRDIKPENIFLDDRGRVLITDFGLVLVTGATQLTQTGYAMGTPLYMSPEQWEGKGASSDPGGELVDARSDIYALGAVLFYLVNGYPPYKGDTFSILANMARNKHAPFRTGTPLELKLIIEKAMSYDKKDRFQSVAEMAQALAVLKQRRPGVAFPSLKPVEVAL